MQFARTVKFYDAIEGKCFESPRRPAPLQSALFHTDQKAEVEYRQCGVHGHIHRVLLCIIQHLLLPAYVVDSQRIRAVRVEPWLDRRGWVFVSRINSCKRGRERFLLAAEPAIVFHSGVSFTIARSTFVPMCLPMISEEYFPFTCLYISDIFKTSIEVIFINLKPLLLYLY